MVHGTPDWYDTAPLTSVHRVTDLGELAARLGSIVTFDRRGNVYYPTSFEEGLGGWQPLKSGLAADVGLSTEWSLWGALSVKLTAGSHLERYAAIRRWLPRPEPLKIGQSASFVLGDDGEEIRSQLVVRYDDVKYEGRISYYQDTQKVQYLGAGGTMVDLITGLNLYVWSYMHHTMKFVIDLEAGEYLRAIVNDEAVSMAGISLWKPGDPGPDYLSSAFWNIGDLNKNNVVYVDGLILTEDEPG